MCGLVGLHLRGTRLEDRLGLLLSDMLSAMATRGPDSAGAAVYTQPDAASKLSLLAPAPREWGDLEAGLAAALGAPANNLTVRIDGRDDVAIVHSSAEADVVAEQVGRLAPDVLVIGAGASIEVYKHVGHASQIAACYGLDRRRGFQGIGHTRMATESAVTTAHSHPFAPGEDVALVHNGSFSNYATVRRRLRSKGVEFDTDNDSEVAARLVAQRMALGDDLRSALAVVSEQMDGFYTLLVTTATEFAVVRDPFACKPAVIAETDDYVAVASEYHALTALPGIAAADVYEPVPNKAYVWKR